MTRFYRRQRQSVHVVPTNDATVSTRTEMKPEPSSKDTAFALLSLSSMVCDTSQSGLLPTRPLFPSEVPVPRNRPHNYGTQGVVSDDEGEGVACLPSFDKSQEARYAKSSSSSHLYQVEAIKLQDYVPKKARRCRNLKQAGRPLPMPPRLPKLPAGCKIPASTRLIW
jgi:hypothetical protein